MTDIVVAIMTMHKKCTTVENLTLRLTMNILSVVLQFQIHQYLMLNKTMTSVTYIKSIHTKVHFEPIASLKNAI